MAAIEIEGLAELRAALARMSPALDRSLDEALADAARMVADRARGNAPVRSGLLRSSTRDFAEAGAVRGVEVTARRKSRHYPGGFPYPVRVERRRGFLRSAIAEEGPRVTQRIEQVLDDVQRAWEG